eukprot:GFUD01038416.1.p1 GENE.GFUD01038416.1~~GFUD01038416.1.p1  ORF type:complete len:438 (+),score=134.65 GFUD01038416.1:55-1368(+)
MEAKPDNSNNNDVKTTKRKRRKFEQQVLDDVDKEDLGENETELVSNMIKELQKQNSMIEEEKDALKKERDAIKKDRHGIKKAIDASEKEKDAIKKDRDDIKKDRDDIKKDRDGIKKERDASEKEKDAIKKDRDTIKKDREGLKKEREASEKEIDAIKENVDTLNDDRAALEQKYNALTSKLRDRVECPVCLQIPTSGPVHVCPNGHLVCSTCRRVNCGICSTRISGKSLLAVTVIENIEHKCQHEGCEELLPLEKYKQHLKLCPHRVVRCPAPQAFCGKDMALSRVYDHILRECEGSCNSDESCEVKFDGFPQRLIIHGSSTVLSRGVALSLHGIHFYLSHEIVHPFNVFNIQLLDSAVKCEDYEVNIAVHRPEDAEMKGKHVKKFSGEPLPIDMEQEKKKQNGLIVGPMQMKKVSVKIEDEDGLKFKFGLTFYIKK